MFSTDIYSKLYEQFRKPIFRYVRSRIADENIAEELTQDVFFKAYRSRDTYSADYAYSTWLWTITRNTISDHLRSMQAAAAAQALVADDVEPDELPSKQPSIETVVIRRDERRLLLRLLKRLTRPQRRVLWLRAVHEFSYDEISRHLGLSLAAVKNLAHRARERLRLDETLAGMRTLA